MGFRKDVDCLVMWDIALQTKTMQNLSPLYLLLVFEYLVGSVILGWEPVPTGFMFQMVT